LTGDWEQPPTSGLNSFRIAENGQTRNGVYRCALLAAIVLAEKAPIHNRQISLKKTLLHWELLPLKHN